MPGRAYKTFFFKYEKCRQFPGSISQLIILYLGVRVGRSVSLSLALEKLELFPCSPHLSIVVEDDGVIEVNERVIPGGGRLYDTVGPGSSGVLCTCLG